MLISVTNAGKTTLMQNLSLSLAAGEPFPPLGPDGVKPFRVLYCDFESPQHKFLGYVEKMLSNIKNKETALDNFIPLADALLADQPFDLSNPRHFEYLLQHAAAVQPDLIVIDTVTAAFDLKDENSNAEVTSRVMKPLKRLARQSNVALVFCHHSGKPSEGLTIEKAYSGRGASAFGGLCRASYLITRDRKMGEGYVALECTKVKGEKFDSILLKRNPDRAWFETCNEQPSIHFGLTAMEVAAFIGEKGREVKRREIVEHFKNRVSAKTLDRRLKDAVKLRIIESPRKGVFQAKRKLSGEAS